MRRLVRIGRLVFFWFIIVPLAKLRFRLRRVPKAELTINSPLTPIFKAVCFYVTFTRSLDASHRRFIDDLMDLGVYVVLVSNHPAFDGHKATHAFVENKNVGKDIGGYKRTTEAFRNMYPEAAFPARILYANDSVFYLGDKSTLRGLLDETKGDWAGVIWNIGGVPHISSWLFAVSRRVFFDDMFVNFWRSYLPLDMKYWLIRRGEVGLTEVAVRMGITPSALYGFESLLEVWDKTVEAVGPERAERMLSEEYGVYCRNLNLPSNTTRKNIAWLLAQISPYHLFQLIFLHQRLCGFVKKDLFWHGRFLFSQADLIGSLVAQHVGAEEAADMMGYYLRRGQLRYSPRRWAGEFFLVS